MKRVTVYQCEICEANYPTEEQATACELRSIPGFKTGDHIALNPVDPGDGMTGIIRWIGERGPHVWYAVLARTDKHYRGGKSNSAWLVYLDGKEKIIPLPEGVVPIEPQTDRFPSDIISAMAKEEAK